MAVKEKVNLKKNVTFSFDAKGAVSYADYYLNGSVFSSVKIFNGNSENVKNISVCFKNPEGLLIENKFVAEEIPFESQVEISVKNILSPLFLSDLSNCTEQTVTAELSDENGVFSTVSRTVTVLPFDVWCSLKYGAETAVPFVRPSLSAVSHILKEAKKQLKDWEGDADDLSYQSNDKNKVRLITAAVYSAIKKSAFEEEKKEGEFKKIDDGDEIISKKKTDALSLAVFFCSCLERAGLNPLLFIGKKDCAVGVWLYNSCFLDSSDDDFTIIENYSSDGINNISCFSVGDLFGASRASYALAEKHFKENASLDEYLSYADVKRSRLAGFKSLPLKVNGAHGYEIVKSEETSFDSKPENISSLSSFKSETSLPKNKQWERRLLDLSLKNTLLNFNPNKGVLRLISSSPDKTFEALKKGEMTIKPVSSDFSGIEDTAFKNVVRLKRYSELIDAENSNGIIRSFSDEKSTAEVLTRLIKKNKSATEESGCGILYVAAGFLKWTSKEDGKEKFAPICLLPVNIKKNKGNSAYALSASEEFPEINSTLLEFLKREFNVDARGLDGSAASLKISEITAMLRAETSSLKGWDVTNDVYLSAFSFSRYAMWRDLRDNIDEFAKNEIVSSLLENRRKIEIKNSDIKSEDDAETRQTLTPLPTDGSQFEAIAYSQTGNTFVLHGPPGTGKSQTITNIIANALYDGKKVLFVAEKQAALDVVKKRLDGIGIGDFCLEVNATKADILKKLDDVLHLSEKDEKNTFSADASTIDSLKKLIENPHSALHKKRRLGISVYEGMIIYLQNKNAPDILNIESSFYDSLTAEKLSSYENMLSLAAAAAKECGEVKESPFKNVNLTEYSVAKRDEVYCSSQVMLSEIRHLKNYISLFLELYRQKISKFTREKLSALLSLDEMLLGGFLNKYYTCDEEQFNVFFRACKRMDYCLEEYGKKFDKLIALPDDAEKYSAEINTIMSDGVKKVEDLKKHRRVYKVYKALSRINRKSDFSFDEALTYLSYVGDIASSADALENCVFKDRLVDCFGKFSFKKKSEFCEELKIAHSLASKIFMDYNADSFNSCCIRAAGGYSRSALEGLKNSVHGYSEAERSFISSIKADESKILCDDILDYYTDKAETLIDNVDKLSCWCEYKKCVKKLDDEGLKFIGESLESGRFSSGNILSGFRKNVYKYFVETNIATDKILSGFSAAVLEENIEKYRLTLEKFSSESENVIKNKLISYLSSAETEFSSEYSVFLRAFKSGGRGMSLREIFMKIPNILKLAAPCLLMSPSAVSQYLEPKCGFYDTVIFDEASQMPTSEAIASLARADSAVIVGDPKQLPPTSFFSAVYVDEDNPENEDMESVLDDALALGLPERYLTWHYRSKHESLIAFSNIMYYDNKLCTFPSPDAQVSRVKLIKTDGEYERGGSKVNRNEAAALVAEVIRRLSDPELKNDSIGIVTFSNVQREYIERKLASALSKRKLEDAAYERDEPLFVKNLENVQGDERDVILFSVCYGPDKNGKLSLNFGPLNQVGGWRRLNVAASRARSEMLIFSSMTHAMIDLSKTSSKGVAGLKAFLEFAEKGKTSLAIKSENVKSSEGMGKFIAAELKQYGYDCRYDVGISDFKIDVAVIDPEDKSKFILAVILDGSEEFSIKDRNILQIQTLKRNNWNVMRIFAVNYFANPKREIKKIKDVLDKITGAGKKNAFVSRYKKAYKAAVLEQRNENSAYVSSGENDTEIITRLKAIVAAEEPISEKFLIKRCFSSLGISRPALKAEARMKSLVLQCDFSVKEICSERYCYADENVCAFNRYRIDEDGAVKLAEADLSAFDIITFIQAVLEERVSVRISEIVSLASAIFATGKPTERFSSFISDLINYGENQGLFVRSVSDRVSLA